MNIHSGCIFLLYIFCVIFHLFFHIIIVVYIFEYNFVHCWFFFVFSFHNIQFFYTFIMLTYYCCYIVVLFLFIECFCCLFVCPVSQCLFMFLFSHNFAAKRLTTVFISCRRIYTAFYTRMSFKFVKNLQKFPKNFEYHSDYCNGFLDKVQIYLHIIFNKNNSSSIRSNKHLTFHIEI